jgi:hypothetical protein
MLALSAGNENTEQILVFRHESSCPSVKKFLGHKLAPKVFRRWKPCLASPSCHRPSLPAAHFERNDVTGIYETVH